MLHYPDLLSTFCFLFRPDRNLFRPEICGLVFYAVSYELFTPEIFSFFEKLTVCVCATMGMEASRVEVASKLEHAEALVDVLTLTVFFLCSVHSMVHALSRFIF